MISYSELKENEQIKTYIRKADEVLCAMGYTEHSFAHSGKVAEAAKYILETLGYSQKEIELAQIAAYLHDIGNIVNRENHAQSGAVIAFRILENIGMNPDDIAEIVSAIGNHDEGSAFPVSSVSAALILADKTDVRRSRVRNAETSTFDIHDRVNYSVEEARISLDTNSNTFTLFLDIDTKYGSVMDYFEIFLGRMILCRKAAEKLGLTFRLFVNQQQLL